MTEKETAAISMFILDTGLPRHLAEYYAFNIARIGDRVTLRALKAEHRSATKNYR